MSNYPNHSDDRREFDDLSIPEQILHVQDLWDKIAASSQNVDLTPEQIEEVERRLLEHETAPAEYPSWEEIKRELVERQ